jgi:hypothetical protein
MLLLHSTKKPAQLPGVHKGMSQATPPRSQQRLKEFARFSFLAERNFYPFLRQMENCYGIIRGKQIGL